jgi:hypothetical protein
MLVAVEASADALGAGLARALKERLGEGVTFVGVGGARMGEEGVASPASRWSASSRSRPPYRARSPTWKPPSASPRPSGPTSRC